VDPNKETLMFRKLPFPTTGNLVAIVVSGSFLVDKCGGSGFTTRGNSKALLQKASYCFGMHRDLKKHHTSS
jgi:hypothetical protein